MSKILECKKINHEYFYLVAFEHAVYVEPKLFSEREIIRLNKLRETSLFQFYRTGVKSIYSYTCQSVCFFSYFSMLDLLRLRIIGRRLAGIDLRMCLILWRELPTWRLRYSCTSISLVRVIIVSSCTPNTYWRRVNLHLIDRVFRKIITKRR